MKKDETGSPIKYSIWDTATNENQPITDMLKNSTSVQSQAEDEDKAWEDDRV